MFQGRSVFEPPIATDRLQANERTQTDSDSNLIAPEHLVQSYDSRGHPTNRQSRDAARRIRRAQNDVLSTIGLLEPTNTSSTRQRHGPGRPQGNTAPAISAGTGRQSRDYQRRVALDEFEEWTSLWSSLSCDALSLTATAFLRNQRKRIQTFRLYGGLHLSRIMWVEARHQSVLSYWLASEAATWAEHAIELLGRLIIMTVPSMVGDAWEITQKRLRLKAGEQKKKSRSTDLLVATLETRQVIGAAPPASLYDVLTRQRSLTLSLELLLAPSTAVIALQRLQLLPPKPFLPSIWTYSPRHIYMALLPPLPTRWTFRSSLTFLCDMPTSVIGLSLAMEYCFLTLSAPATRYCRALLPRPDNPEPHLGNDADEAGDPKWFLHGYSHHQKSFLDELGSDLRWVARNITYYLIRTRNIFISPNVRRHREQMLATLRTADGGQLEAFRVTRASFDILIETWDMVHNDVSQTEFQERRQQLIETRRLISEHCEELSSSGRELAQTSHNEREEFIAHARALITETSQRISTLPSAPEYLWAQDQDVAQDQTNDRSSDNQRQSDGPLSSHPISSPAPPPSLAASTPPSSPPLEPTNVQVRTRAGSTSTLHMDVEINRAAVDGTTYTTSFSASPRTPVVETAVSQVFPHESETGNVTLSIKRAQKRPHHKVSALSLLPSELLSMVMVQCIIGVVRLPLETMCLRKVAWAFVKDANSLQTASIYPAGSWFGGASFGWSGRFTYASNIIMCLGAEALINTGCWTLVAKSSLWMGRQWLSWGSL